MKKTLLLSATIFLFSFIIFGCGDKNPKEETQSIQEDFSTICTQNSGTWRAEYKECENISKEICETAKGNFKECESACRHNPETQICTMQCVPVCQFEKMKNKKPKRTDTKPVNGSTPQETSYLIDGEWIVPVEKESTKMDVVKLLKARPFEDIDGDGIFDEIILLRQETAAEEKFTFVAAALKMGNTYKGTNALLLGDHVAPQETKMENGEIVQVYADRRPWESVDKQLSVIRNRRLIYQDGELKEVELPILSQETAEEIATKEWGDCDDGHCTNRSVKILDGKDGLWYIEVVLEGLKDDSAFAQRYRASVKNIDGKWERQSIKSAEYQCNGQSEFAKEKCE